MGFDTYLQVDDRVVLMWRKHAGALPRLLFSFDDLLVRDGEPDDDEEQFIDVRLVTSAANARKNLESAGLGWGAAVAAYAEIRFGGAAVGIMMGRLRHGKTGPEPSDTEVLKALKEFEELPAGKDLASLRELMARQWTDESAESITLLSDLSYGGDLQSSFDVLYDMVGDGEQRKIDNPVAAVRAAESLGALDRTAPLLVWPLVVCVFLHALPDAATVEFVLTEDALDSGDVNDNDSAREYAAKYWSQSSETLAGEARVLERVFAVLAGSTAAAGREFWFARAADLQDRLETLRATPDVTTRARGDALESLVDALFRTEEPELQVVEKNLRSELEEIDLVVANNLRDPFWNSLSSPLILVECKNWSEKPGVPELRVFESKMKDRGALCRIGLFVSLSGFASTFLTRLKRVQEEGGIIFAMDGEDLETLISSKGRLSDWLREEGLRKSIRGRK
ncbi:MAG: restriction endonuclease [Conexibacter sp.]|nr:restriction endonuclease [Conexibacter sp.]